MTSPTPLRQTALAEIHRALGARIVSFACYAMPLHYAEGLVAEHGWTRAHAGLFDVSHMGPAFLHLRTRSGDGNADHRRIAGLIERFVCADICGLRPGALRYALLLDAHGGILDDLLIGRPLEAELQGSLYLVVNAGTKERDFAQLAAGLGGNVRIERRDEGGLLALQGPDAAAVLEAIIPGVSCLSFMRFAQFERGGEALWIARSGYTGEDGFEVLAGQEASRALWKALIADPRVRAIGLGARDSLRLEAGLPLYGHDLDPSVSPIEAGLSFAVARARRERGDLPGQSRLAHEIAEGPSRVRIGLHILEGAPAREGAVICHAGEAVGMVTSGGFSPTLGMPIAMGFVPPALAGPGTLLEAVVRGRGLPARVVPLPFVPHRYVRHSRSGEPNALHPRA
jgi:aminomethyltransferase